MHGSAIDVDNKADDDFYGKSTTAKNLFANASEHNTDDVKALKDQLESLYK